MIEVLKCLCYLTNHGNKKKIKKRERERMMNYAKFYYHRNNVFIEIFMTILI